ncbi:MAG: hypothetical protein KBF32_00510 [Chitinophagales bacterium]|nr:hypothetical protein [Chitinophagales bacterium]
MKHFTILALLVLFASATSFAQLSPEKALSTYNKVKGQYDGLVTKWKPVKEKAIQNSATLSPELKSSLEKVDGDVNSFGAKLSSFPSASVTDQAAMAATLKSEYSTLKSSVSDVTKQVSKLEVPKM